MVTKKASKHKERKVFTDIEGFKLYGLSFIKYFHAFRVTLKVQSTRSRLLRTYAHFFFKSICNQNHYISEHRGRVGWNSL